jgi:hypothetical protein
MLMIASWLLVAAFSPAQTGTAAGQVGDILRVKSAPTHWRVGLPVAVLWYALPDKRPSVVAHGKVESLLKGQATVRLSAGSAGKISHNSVVVARYLVEAELFGGDLPDLPQPAGVTEKKKLKRVAPIRMQHRSPGKAEWGEPVWIEVATDSKVDAIVVMTRFGVGGGFEGHELKKGEDGHWSVRIKLGAARPGVMTLQYYLVGVIAKTRLNLQGSPATPMGISIQTEPRRARRSTAVHHAPGRWNHREALVLRAQVDAVYSKPLVHWRGAGEGRFSELPMKSVGGGVFEATLAADKVLPPHLRYYISAHDEEGNRHPVFSNALQPHKVKVVRGRMLDGLNRRNRLRAEYEIINRGSDASQRFGLRYERAFFPFLLARLGLLNWQESSLREAAIGGEAGIELRLKSYLSATADLQTVAYGDGSALGYKFGLRIGDEAGASVGGSYGYAFDLSDRTPVGELLSASLAVPVGRRLQLAGVFQSDDFFADDLDDLRLVGRLTGRFGGRLEISLAGGMATRGQGQRGAYFASALGFGF